ncbi:hypothetical protein [Nocardia cyriacigeorgica]|uniref:hypothetical protein n=1 Tax=Nocardia cyriacigeorgica TaxID=135487 RepID=UPI002454588A|nr:hypothetical protein [Nocardia cyriacigeorgica]
MSNNNWRAIHLTNELSPAVPQADYADVANEIANYVMQEALQMSDRLRNFLDERYEAAPTSVEHGHVFDALLVRSALDWVRRWPV